MLDNDLIRLNQKLNLILEYQEKQRLHKMDYLEEEEEQQRERSKQNRKKTLGSD